MNPEGFKEVRRDFREEKDKMWDEKNAVYSIPSDALSAFIAEAKENHLSPEQVVCVHMGKHFKRVCNRASILTSPLGDQRTIDEKEKLKSVDSYRTALMDLANYTEVLEALRHLREKGQL